MVFPPKTFVVHLTVVILCAIDFTLASGVSRGSTLGLLQVLIFPRNPDDYVPREGRVVALEFNIFPRKFKQNSHLEGVRGPRRDLVGRRTQGWSSGTP